jgi:hypothetical protein
MCSDCYLISSGWVESTFTNKSIPILYLPWWDAFSKSRVCNHSLKFVNCCQKWCSDCFIVYVGCRYCLTTNIIFGITDQTQCKKCKRVSKIDIDVKNVSSGNHKIDEFLVSTRTNIDNTNINAFTHVSDVYSSIQSGYAYRLNRLYAEFLACSSSDLHLQAMTRLQIEPGRSIGFIVILLFECLRLRGRVIINFLRPSMNRPLSLRQFHSFQLKVSFRL